MCGESQSWVGAMEGEGEEEGWRGKSFFLLFKRAKNFPEGLNIQTYM